MMKIAIGVHQREPPWGGGMQFAASLANFLRQRGSELRFGLEDPDLDVILLMDPRRHSSSSSFNDVDILSYLMNTNPHAIVVQRVNDSSASRSGGLRSFRLWMANRCAHHTVFISRWLRDSYRNDGYTFVEPTVIQNGADRSVFHAEGGAKWDGHEKLRIVTHHWSNNPNKGFDVYSHVDGLLGQRPFCDLFEFTFIGRIPRNMKFHHSRHVQPLSGSPLADVLRTNHVYLTASQSEAAGMHHIEGSLCGLPVLYRKSGALPEYCEGFGVQFDKKKLDTRLLDIRERYSELKARMPEYPYDAERSGDAYESLFRDLLAHRDAVLRRRRWTHLNVWTSRGGASTFDLCNQWFETAKSYYRLALERSSGHNQKITRSGP